MTLYLFFFSSWTEYHSAYLYSVDNTVVFVIHQSTSSCGEKSLVIHSPQILEIRHILRLRLVSVPTLHLNQNLHT